jgi:hypothetical protein
MLATLGAAVGCWVLVPVGLLLFSSNTALLGLAVTNSSAYTKSCKFCAQLLATAHCATETKGYLQYRRPSAAWKQRA